MIRTKRKVSWIDSFLVMNNRQQKVRVIPHKALAVTMKVQVGDEGMALKTPQACGMTVTLII